MLEPKPSPRFPLASDPSKALASLSDVVCLRIVLLEIIPPAWRRLRVPAHWTLRHLHSLLQCATGLSGGETHRFRVGNVLYGKTSDGAGSRDSRWTTLADVVALGPASFRYELVSDETWEHEVFIESVREGSAENQRPVCLGGEGIWPPMTCGSADAYLEGSDGLAAETGAFDLDAVNRALARLG